MIFICLLITFIALKLHTFFPRAFTSSPYNFYRNNIFVCVYNEGILVQLVDLYSGTIITSFTDENYFIKTASAY